MNKEQIWLMSFADFAFILLIAFIQAPGDGRSNINDLELPHTVDGGKSSIPDTQIRIRQREGKSNQVYQILVSKTLTLEEETVDWIDFEELKSQLIEKHQLGYGMPQVIPRRHAIAEDLTLAVSLVNAIYKQNPVIKTVFHTSQGNN